MEVNSFDPTLGYSDTTTGLVVNSYNNGYGSPQVTAFNYDPTRAGGCYWEVPTTA